MLRGMAPARGLLLLVLLAAGSVALATSPTATDGAAWPQGMLEVIKTEDGSIVQVEEFRGPPKSSALPYLFTNTQVLVHCPAQTGYSVYTGRSIAELKAALGRGDRAWCGWAHLMRDAPNCTVSIRPYGSTFVAVVKPKAWLAGEPRQCQLVRVQSLSMPRLLAAVLGAFMFWSAGVLSESTPFRLTGGTLGFMALSSIILLFVLYRKVPHKGKLLAGTAVFGSSFLATVRWLFGVWLPSTSQVLRHPLTLGYLAVSGLAGLALTYYYNNSDNRKVNNMLRVALQLVGLASVGLSPSMPEAGLALCLGLLGAKAYGFLQQHTSLSSAIVSAKQEVQQQLAGEGPEPLPGVLVGAPAAVVAAHTAALGGGSGTPTAYGHLGVPEVSPLVQRGMVLNEETGHIISIGKATYNRLIEQGYVLDTLAGTLTPPPPSPDSPARPSTGSRARGARRRRTP